MWTVALPLTIPVSRNKRFSLNLNIYRNAHHRVTNKAKINYSLLVRDLVKHIPKQSHITLQYVLFVPTNRRLDISNVCSIVDKFFCDALVEHGVLEDDSYEYLKKVEYLFGGLDRTNPRIEVTIIPEEQDMRIILDNVALQQAAINYVNSVLTIAEGQTFTVDLDESVTAEVVIVAEGSEPVKTETKAKGPFVKEPVKRTRRTKAEMEAAQEILELDEQEEEEEEVPVVEVVTEVEEASEPVAQQEEEVVKPKGKSLFGGLNRPKNS